MYYGWIIVLVTFVTNFISVGFIFYSYGAFITPLSESLGGSRFAVSLGVTAMHVAAGLSAPFLGKALDAGFVRRLMAAGALMLGIGFMLAATVQSLLQLQILLGSLLGVGAAMIGVLPGSTLIANWFVERRGVALGMATMGVSTSGLIMAPLATALIGAFGWRATFLIYGAVTLVVVLPVVYFIVVRRPEDLGLLPDGAKNVVDLDRALAADLFPEAIGPRDLVRDFNFWALVGTVGLTLCATQAMLTHLIPHGIDLGYTAGAAALVLSLCAGAGVFGKMAYGLIVDKAGPRPAFWLTLLVQALGVLTVSFATGYWILALGAALFGFGMGGVVPVWGALVGACYGRRVFGRVMGLMSPSMLPLQIAGIPLAGLIHDQTGSYDSVFAGFLALYAIAACLLLAVVRGKRTIRPSELILLPENEGINPIRHTA